MAVLGILLMLIGAVLLWGVDLFTSGVNLHAIGVIFLVLGAISFVAGLVSSGGLGFGTRARTERHVSGDGRHVVEESSYTDF